MTQYSTEQSQNEFDERELHWIQRIGTFLLSFPQAEWGPGHVVLSDYNFDSIDFCLAECETLISGTKSFSEVPTVSYDDVIATQKFLLEMKGAFDAS